MQATRVLPLFGMGLGSLWVGAIGVRSIWARLVADRYAGQPVSLSTMTSVIEAEPRLWRGPLPPPAGYDELAEAGVGLIVDLRSEADLEAIADRVEAAGMALLALPTTNSRPPDPSHIDRLAKRHQTHPATTYVHCEAGEGRTGAIVGAYQTRRGQPTIRVISEQLAVGSLTISQMAYVATGGRYKFICTLLDLGVDRPTETLFDLLR